MKRLFAIGLSLLMLVGFPANAVEISDCALQRYADWKAGVMRGYWNSRVFSSMHNHYARARFGFEGSDMLQSSLAVAPDGSWATGTAPRYPEGKINNHTRSSAIASQQQSYAQEAALKHCNERFNTSSCRIIDDEIELPPPTPEMKVYKPSETRKKRVFDEKSRSYVWHRWCAEKSKPPYLSAPGKCNGVTWNSKQDAELLYLLITTDPTPIFGRPEDDANCGTATAPSTPPKQEESNLRLLGTGTGFLVNKDYIVTAEHVLEKCNELTVRHAHKEYWTTVAARDPSNDLGLLQLEKPLEHYAKLRGGKAIRLGESISTYGYPLFGELSDSAKITKGNINSLAGIGNDSRVIQFDAPTQPGNSGGPVLDSSGNVVGVVSHGLSKRYADQSGHIAQNVNFAVKSYLVEGFLSSNNVSFEKAESTEKLELPDIAEKAEKFTVLVGCWE